MKTVIKKAELKRIDEIWKKHKPQGLGFSDTDVIILDLKVEKNDKFIQNFYCRLKGDGTLGHSITKGSEKRQNELKKFIREYISKSKNYNVRNEINTWIGKKVEAEKINGYWIIKL